MIYSSDEHCYSSDYETIEDQGSFEWGMYSNGEVPPNALVVSGFWARDSTLYIGRTVTGSDISTVTT